MEVEVAVLAVFEAILLFKTEFRKARLFSDNVQPAFLANTSSALQCRIVYSEPTVVEAVARRWSGRWIRVKHLEHQVNGFL